MPASRNGASAPIIIKRVTVNDHHAHHGGAWKIAYADFVTAMMAFFLLMWLVSATTEKQRQGLASYFDPTIVQVRSGGGDDIEQGHGSAEADDPGGAEDSSFESIAQHIQDQLTGSGAESAQMTNLLKHVVTRMTDEGLVIELTDLTDQPLFVEDTEQPQQAMRDLSMLLANVLGDVRNQIAISGHVRSYPDVLKQSPVWTLSDARGHSARSLLEQSGLDEKRIQRVTGHADRSNRSQNPMDPANNRIEVILLR